ncbi:MAG: EAL domain-containing protein [Pseudomonadota bacterium]
MEVLVVEDNEADVEMVTISLRRADKGINVTAVPSLGDAKEALDTGSFDIALLDLSLPDSYGLGSIKELQRVSESLPIVVLSGDDNEHTALSAARLGVEDYIAKGDSIGQPFVRTLRYAIERKKGEKRLRDLADYDQLTRLSNRQRFNRQLLKAVGHAERSGELMALLFIDLNEFKAVNDTLGHHAGDELLSQVAVRFRNCVRSGDLVGRIGGDEFAILAEAITSPLDAEIVADKIIESLQQPFVLGGHTVKIGASIGISLFPHDASDAEELLTRSDVAMYQAKRNGRNKVMFYSAKFNETAEARNRRLQELTQAIAHEQFEIFYQPKACAKTHKLVGLEALVRWNHPELGMLDPDKFVQFAEENGMISAIDEWVLQAVASDIVRWQDASLDTVPVSINVSASHVLRSDILSEMKNLFDQTGVDPHLVRFDLTESVLQAEHTVTQEALQQLQEMGVNIWLNDFGTGYSAMSYLNDFPLDGICIARTFTSTLGDRKTNAIVRSIVTLAHNLQLGVAGIGVETKEQLKALKALGCDMVQGNFYGVPMRADDVREHFLRERRDTVTGIMRTLNASGQYSTSSNVTTVGADNA